MNAGNSRGLRPIGIGRLWAMLACLIGLAVPASLAADRFVSLDGTNDSAHGYTNWIGAATNIQYAIDIAQIGETVWVSNGVYDVGGVTNYATGSLLTNRVAITKAITLRSLNDDRTNTIIKGSWDPVTTNGPSAVRCVYMAANSSLIGFTLTNGATLAVSGGASLSGRGGGIHAANNSATISNCVLVNNSAYEVGGGAYYGTLRNCTVITNSANGAGAGGGGTRYSYLYDCTLNGNWAASDGGAIYGGTASNCTVVSNFTVAGSGGGARDGILYNCLLVNNRAGYGGGGARGGTMYNCTFGSNSCPNYANNGDGAYQTIMSNCVSWGSKYNDLQVTAAYSCGAGYTNGGANVGNISSNPNFVDSANGNHRLSKGSLCINSGTNQVWMSGKVDLDGHARIDRYSGMVDMGAYEYIPHGTLLNVR